MRINEVMAGAYQHQNQQHKGKRQNAAENREKSDSGKSSEAASAILEISAQGMERSLIESETPHLISRNSELHFPQDKTLQWMIVDSSEARALLDKLVKRVESFTF